MTDATINLATIDHEQRHCRAYLDTPDLPAVPCSDVVNLRYRIHRRLRQDISLFL